MSRANRKATTKARLKRTNHRRAIINGVALGGGVGLSGIGHASYQKNAYDLAKLNQTASINLAHLRDRFADPKRHEKARRLARQLYRGRLSNQKGMRYRMPAPALDSVALDKAASRLNARAYLRASRMMANKMNYGEVLRNLNRSKAAMGVGGLLTLGVLSPVFTKGILKRKLPKEKGK